MRRDRSGRKWKLVTASFVGAALTVFAQPSVLNYRGHIKVEGKPYNGAGYFTFAILNAEDAMLWFSGELPKIGATNNPPTAKRIAVMHGNYGVRLGDARVGMMPLDAAMVTNNARLRIWFNDGVRGWQIVERGTQMPAGTGLSNSIPRHIETPPTPEEGSR